MRACVLMAKLRFPPAVVALVAEIIAQPESGLIETRRQEWLRRIMSEPPSQPLTDGLLLCAYRLAAEGRSQHVRVLLWLAMATLAAEGSAAQDALLSSSELNPSKMLNTSPGNDARLRGLTPPQRPRRR